MGLSQWPVGFLSRLQQVLLHRLVLTSAAGCGLHAVGHLTVRVNLLNDAANQAGTCDGGKGATHQPPSPLSSNTGGIERRVNLLKVAVDRLGGACHHLVRAGQLAAQLCRGGLDLDQHPLDLLVGHANLQAQKTAPRRHAVYCLGRPRRKLFNLSATLSRFCGDAGVCPWPWPCPRPVQSIRASRASMICGMGVCHAVSGGQPSQPVATPNR